MVVGDGLIYVPFNSDRGALAQNMLMGFTFGGGNGLDPIHN